MRRSLERLKEIVPLGPHDTRHTTLSLLEKARSLIKVRLVLCCAFYSIISPRVVGSRNIVADLRWSSSYDGDDVDDNEGCQARILFAVALEKFDA